jgi:tRNA-specific 2-thiouridylase
VADKPDSQEICFVSEAGGYRQFLRKVRPEMFAEGEMVTVGGESVGVHKGVADFTIGQRRGLRVAQGKPLYVIGLEPKENRVIVGTDDDLRMRRVHLSDVIWSGKTPDEAPLRVMAKIRYNMEARPARLFAGAEPFLEFDEPVRAVTPGQVAVAYQGQTVAAGGTILRGS